MGKHLVCRGKRNNIENQSYSFVDQIVSDTASSIFYRLKQIDLGGGYSHSDIITVNFNNPISDFVLFRIIPIHLIQVQKLVDNRQSAVIRN